MKYYKKPELEMTTFDVDDYIATLSVIDNSSEGIEDGGGIEG